MPAIQFHTSLSSQGWLFSFRKGGIGYNLPPNSIMGTGCPDPDGSGLTLAAGVRMKVISESVLTGTADFVVSFGDPSITMDMYDIVLLDIDMGNTTGNIRFDSSQFKGVFEVDKTFLNGAVHLTGGSGIRIAEDWYVYIGTVASEGKEPATASFFDGLFNGHGKFRLDSSGYSLGMGANYSLSTPTVFKCSAGIDGTVSGEFAMQLPSLSFNGSLTLDAGIGLHTPLGYLGEHESLGIGIGCCSPAKLNLHWSKDACVPCLGGIEGGFSIDFLPSLDFNPWVHTKRCGCPKFW